MVCEDSNATIAFIGPAGDYGNPILEITPQTMTYERNIGEFDFARCKFSNDVAQYIEGAVNENNGILNQPLPVVVKLDGKPVQRLLYLPDGVTFGVNNVHIEFHDCRKYLQRGVLDWQEESVTLKDAFKHVFDKREKDGPPVFSGITFTIPDEAYEELHAFYEETWGFQLDAKNPTVSEMMQEEQQSDDYDPDVSVRGFGAGYNQAVGNIEEENVENIIDGYYAVDYEQVSPWEAIRDLNEKFKVRTWVEPDGRLHVGSRTATGVIHYAAPDEPQVWRLLPDGYNIPQNRDPVIKSVVRGKFIDDPGDSAVDNALQWANFTRKVDGDRFSTDNYRAEGVAVRQDSNYGQEIVDTVPASRDVLEYLAEKQLVNAQRDQWSGELEILPSQSGNAWTDIRSVRIGDFIQTFPADEQFNSSDASCESNIDIMAFEVTGIQHRIDRSGAWSVRLDVTPLPAEVQSRATIKTHMRYWDPFDEEFLNEDEYRPDTQDDSFWPDLGSGSSTNARDLDLGGHL